MMFWFSSLQPKELELLLSDLASKLDYKLLTSSKLSSFASTQEAFAMLDLYTAHRAAALSVRFIKYLTLHLETVSGYFQQLIVTYNGGVDGPEMYTDLAELLSHCFYLLLRIVNCILS